MKIAYYIIAHGEYGIDISNPLKKEEVIQRLNSGKYKSIELDCDQSLIGGLDRGFGAIIKGCQVIPWPVKIVDSWSL